MKKWFKKSLVILVSVLSFGIVSPSHDLWNHNHQINRIKQGNTEDYQNSTASLSSEQSDNERSMLIKKMINSAEMQSYEKFGSKIKPVIEDEFREAILPNIETAITNTIMQYPQGNLSKLAISEKPSGGASEKIFHIYDKDLMKDIIRFHVRRDHPPMEGYYFNFHYHVAFDHFQVHHQLGSIYWDKNTPPQWKV
ncbi:YpjP family protein [Heyndrickxia ginsengihumi]|uniref:YpjP family protein n=1 Tax=Heyndrickxia ginsengihumi TaxID=363870 RepID=UPI003D1EF4D4